MSDRRTRARFCSSRLLAFACFALFSAACDAPAPVSRLAGTAEYALIVGANEPQVVRDAVADLRRYLEEMGATSVSLITVPAEASYRWSELEDAATKGVIVVYGDWLVDSSVDAATRTSLVGDSFVIKGRSAAGRTKILVELFAPSSRPRIYSVYDLVQRLGVRFFHPEEEYIPDTLTFPTPPFEHVERPTFKWRGFHLHLTHPLELLDEFSSDDPASVKRARNFIRWLIKLKQNYSSGTSGTAAINAWKKELGLVVGSGLGLTNIQQGGRPLLVPTDPLEVNLSKIEGRLEQIFADPQNLPDFFGVSASDTEIFNSDATKDQILQWFTFATEWVHTRYPEVYLLQNVHITKEEVIPDLGVDVNLVHTLLPPYVNLQIHTVMFYGLHGPAPAYGHETFEDRFALFESELKKGRRMWYFPESAWWLTFDNAVPLFLPIYLKMRWLDLKDLEPMIPQGIDGHLTFTSGHEWGYWITDYCVAQMTWSNSLDWTACLAQITDPMGPSGAEVHNVLVEMGDYQQETLIDRDMHRWLVGEDDLAEVGAKTPKAAHRIRVPFSDLETWTLEQLNAFRSAELADMLEMEQTYGAYLERLRAVAATIRPRAEHLFAEIFDGTEIDYLRARQIRLLYEGLLDAREALLKGDTALLTTARTKLGLAKEVTVDAAKVVTRREALYRYPLRLSSEGSRDHPVPNRTSYPFRVHSDTHVLFFWHRRDKKAQETLDKLEHSLVTISDVLSERSQAVEVLVSPLVASDSRIVFGDGTE
ncbi:MAG: hypothetical protein KC609_00875 [Myxococcales bacterium]|nr:hypothetical protein [Myxococcales bacterium]